MSFHVLFYECFLVRTEVTNQTLGDVIAIDLVSQLLDQHCSLLLHLINLSLGGGGGGGRGGGGGLEGWVE